MINCQDLTKYYKGEDSPAIENICLNVEEKTVFGFLGPNGAGKTTTIKILTGLMSADSGVVTIDGKIMSVQNVKVRSAIGYLGQDHNMYPWMKCRELLLFVGKIFNLSAKESKKRADELLQMSGLTEAKNKKVSSLSGGMKQRLGIAQAMMGNPKVLFLDEPTSALDPIGRKEVLDFILEIKKSCTVFMSTHILADVERVCDHIAIIDKGKIVAMEEIGTLREKFSQKIIEIETVNQNELEKLTKIIEVESNSFEVLKSEQNVLTVYPQNLDQCKKMFLETILKNNIEINRFEFVKPSLEDVFVKLIETNEKQ